MYILTGRLAFLRFDSLAAYRPMRANGDCMGLEEFETESSDKHNVYQSHEKDEKLEQIIEEYQERFPVELRIQFIEVSPKMEQKHAMAYKRAGKKYYIRVSESFIQRSTEEQLRRTVLHEMCHVYLYQQGLSGHGHGKYFRWVVGRVGASMTHSTIHDVKWEKCIQPFIDEDEI